MNVKDTIGIYPGTLSDELCDQLIEAFHQYEEHHYQGVTASGMDKNYKDTTDFDLMKVPELEGLVEQIVDAANEKIDLYVRRYRTTYYPVWQLQRYEKGVGHFKSFHTEGEYSEFCDRLFAVMFYLNDVEEGGETEFLHQSLWVRPTKGTFLIWPAPWPYVHRGHVPVSNDKYILTTWLLRQEN
jgi:hypothetical protein